jgi:ubiquinone/menaquinone biosynthesis C-methylase UbiE
MNYEPREYWPERMRKSGKAYVAFGNKAEAFDEQARAFRDILVEQLRGGGRVLDFGCGVGRFASTLTGMFDRYDGVDLNEGALAYAPQISSATFTYLSEDSLPFAEATFDAAVALTVIQHIVDPDSFINWTWELARVVRPGGLFFVIDDPRFNMAGQCIRDAVHMCRRTPEIISSALCSDLEVIGKLSAEAEDSHYYFLARRNNQ